jgi:O-antigen ligase
MNVIPPIIKPVTRQAWATASLLFLSLLPVLPLFAPWTFAPVASFHKEWLAVAAGLLAALAILPSLWRMEGLSIPRCILIPLGLIVYLALQSKLLPQVVTQHAEMAMIYLLWMAVLILLVAALRETLPLERVAGWLAAGLAAAAAIASVMELVNRLQGKVGWWGGVAQANNYADLLALGGVSLLYINNATKSAYKTYLCLLALLIAMGLSLTPSRSVWLYFGILFAVSWRVQKNWLRGLLLGFAAYLAFQALWTLDLLPQQQSAAQRLVQEVKGAPIRLHIWQVAWQLFLQQPVLGHGFGQFD